MIHLKRSLVTCLLAPLLTILLATTTVAEASPSTCGAWSVVKSPNAGASSNILSGVAAISANDVWAVGTYNLDCGTCATQTLTEHWNGTSWSIIPSPNVGTSHNVLNGVAAVSSSDIWAVGYYLGGGGLVYNTLIEHWNGTSWSVVTSPSPGSVSSFLSGVAAVSSRDVWVVGDFQNDFNGSNTLIEHWNGTKWSVVTSPNAVSGFNYLSGVAAISATNVWAVGDDSASSAPEQTLIEHWNGTKWSVITSPNVASSANYLPGVTAVSASNLWAVGSSINTSTNIYKTLIEHWNGTSWSIVTSPNVASRSNRLFAVAAVSASNLWAVGDSSFDFYHWALIEHWNGTNWSIIKSPNPKGSGVSILGAAARVPLTHKVWAVGSAHPNTDFAQTFTEFYC